MKSETQRTGKALGYAHSRELLVAGVGVAALDHPHATPARLFDREFHTMISDSHDYDPSIDEPAYSLRELDAVFAELTADDLPQVRRYVRLIANGAEPEAAWKSAGLPGVFDDDDAGAIPTFPGRPRALFG